MHCGGRGRRWGETGGSAGGAPPCRHPRNVVLPLCTRCGKWPHSGPPSYRSPNPTHFFLSVHSYGSSGMRRDLASAQSGMLQLCANKQHFHAPDSELKSAPEGRLSQKLPASQRSTFCGLRCTSCHFFSNLLGETQIAVCRWPFRFLGQYWGSLFAAFLDGERGLWSILGHARNA